MRKLTGRRALCWILGHRWKQYGSYTSSRRFKACSRSGCPESPWPPGLGGDDTVSEEND